MTSSRTLSELVILNLGTMREYTTSKDLVVNPFIFHKKKKTNLDQT